MGENRVLTPDEVQALAEGTKVCLECRDKTLMDPDEVTIRRFDDGVGFEDAWGDLYIFNASELLSCEYYRVWALPQPPTMEELAANPWPEVLND